MYTSLKFNLLFLSCINRHFNLGKHFFFHMKGPTFVNCWISFHKDLLKTNFTCLPLNSPPALTCILPAVCPHTPEATQPHINYDQNKYWSPTHSLNWSMKRFICSLKTKMDRKGEGMLVSSLLMLWNCLLSLFLNSFLNTKAYYKDE